MRKKYILFLIVVLLNVFTKNSSFSQSVTPIVLNNGGGFSSTMEWSMNESVSIASFSAGGYYLNTGVLQPLTNMVTGITEYGPVVFGNQITMSPNPTPNILHVKANMNQLGNLSIQLLDAKSTTLFTQESGVIYSSYDKDIQMQSYNDGIFYLRIYFKPNIGIAKTGIYKIIKLSK